MELKRLRDDTGHAKLGRSYGRNELCRTTIADLFHAELVSLGHSVLEVGNHYGLE